MYPFERYMKILKGYVRNRYCPEASIVESYIAEEVIELCTDYLSEVQAIGVPICCHSDRLTGKGTLGMKARSMPREDVLQAYLYILNNTDKVQPYIEEHMTLVNSRNLGKNSMWKISEYNRTFIDRFEKWVDSEVEVSDTLRWLANGPHLEVITYNVYDINGYSFYTKGQDDKNTMQNSRVSLLAHVVHFASSKDKNLIAAEMTYYGVIEEIWELDYTIFREPVFKCKWVVDNNYGTRVDSFGFILVNFSREGHKKEPFVMASQGKQVFYINDPADKNWHVVLEGRSSFIGDEDDEDDDDLPSGSTFSFTLPRVNDEDNIDKLCAREDHTKGMWIVDDNQAKKQKD